MVVVILGAVSVVLFVFRRRLFRWKTSKITVLNKDVAGTLPASANNTGSLPNVDTEDVENESDTKR